MEENPNISETDGLRIRIEQINTEIKNHEAEKIKAKSRIGEIEVVGPFVDLIEKERKEK